MYIKDMCASSIGRVAKETILKIYDDILKELKVPPIEIVLELYSDEDINIAGQLCCCIKKVNTGKSNHYTYYLEQSHIEIYAHGIYASTRDKKFVIETVRVILHELKHHAQFFYGKVRDKDIDLYEIVSAEVPPSAGSLIEIDADEWSHTNLHKYYEKVRDMECLLLNSRMTSGF